MCSAWSCFAAENVRLFSSLRANDSGSAIDSQLFLGHHSHRHEREDWTGEVIRPTPPPNGKVLQQHLVHIRPMRGTGNRKHIVDQNTDRPMRRLHREHHRRPKTEHSAGTGEAATGNDTTGGTRGLFHHCQKYLTINRSGPPQARRLSKALVRQDKLLR
jgi:hypothetical protein